MNRIVDEDASPGLREFQQFSTKLVDVVMNEPTCRNRSALSLQHSPALLSCSELSDETRNVATSGDR
jgi:hypothetical protein